MNVADRLRLGSQGLTSRRTRTALSALGIALGITALVGVLGLSASSKADLNAQLQALGTNMLTVQPGQGLFGDEVTLPDEAGDMIRRIPTVESASAVRVVPQVSVRKTDAISEGKTSGLSAGAADLDLLETVGGTMDSGRWLDKATADYPAVVLGSTAAWRLAAHTGDNVYLDGQWFTVIGVLDPVVLAPEVNEIALMGSGVATKLYGDDLPPTSIYTRVQESAVTTTRALLGRTADPESPSEVAVTRPSDVLEAQAATDKSLTMLTLGLGAVALLVGAVGIANVMVISVLERRREIGVRRALGATRLDIGAQFLAESVLLSLLGGAAGVLLGLGVTLGWSVRQDWLLVIPWTPIGLGMVCSLVVGSVVGLYPSLRAASVPPTEALRSM